MRLWWRGRPRITMRTRIAATVALAVVGSTVTVTFVAYELERRGTESRFVAAAEANVSSDVTQAAEAARKVPAPKRAQVVTDFVRQRIGVDWRVRSTIGGGTAQICTADHLADQMEAITEPGVSETRWVMLCDGHKHLAVSWGVVKGVNLTEFYDFRPARDQLARLRTGLLWVDLAGLGVGLFVGALVGMRIGRPLRRAAATARDFGAGDLSARISVRGRSELSELGEAFNDMAARHQATMSELRSALTELRDAHEQQRQFVSDVSHELRTPLAAMLAASDGMSSDDPVARLRAEDLLVDQTRRLTKLVDDLLEISRFDAGQAQLEIDEVSLDELSRDAVWTVVPEAAVQVTIRGDVLVRADPRRLHTIVRNLVANAVQHGAPPVDVVVDGRDSEVVAVTVSDSGPGIDPQLASQIFRRFVRADPSRSTSDARRGAAGLGLAIAEENAHLHGTSITLSTAGRTAFTVRLPRRQLGSDQDVDAGRDDDARTAYAVPLRVSDWVCP